MTTPTGNETFLTVTNESVNLPNSRQLTADPFTDNLELLDGGPAGQYQLTTTGNLKSLVDVNASGLLAYNSASQTFSPRTLTSDATVSIANANGATTNPIISVNDNTSVQRVNVATSGTTTATRSKLNFINGADITVSVSDDGSNDQANITISSSGASALTSTYVLNTPDVKLPNAQALSALSTGLMKVTTTTGIVSTAVAGTDYVEANAAINSLAAITPAVGDLITSSSAGTYSKLSIGTSGQVLTSNGTGVEWAAAGGGGAPADATYIVQTASAGLSNEQALSSLATGVVNVETGTGVLSSLGVGTNGQVLTSNGTAATWAAPTIGAPSDATYIVQTASGGLSAEQALSSLSTGVMSVTTGTGVISSLGVGTSGQVLTSNGTTATWATPAAGSTSQWKRYTPSGTLVDVELAGSAVPFNVLSLDVSSFTDVDGFDITFIVDSSFTPGTTSGNLVLWLCSSNTTEPYPASGDCIWQYVYPVTTGGAQTVNTGYVTVTFRAPAINTPTIYLNAYITAPAGVTGLFSTINMTADVTGYPLTILP